MPPSLPQRVAQVFVAPASLFRELRERPVWLGALILVVLVGIGVAATTPPEVFLDRMRDPTDRLGRPVPVTSGPEAIVRWGRILQAFSAAAMLPVVAFAAAGMLTLLFKVILRGSATYRQYLAVTAHVLLIPAVGALLLRVWSLLSGGGRTALSLATFAPGIDPGGWLYGWLDGLNLFTLWAVGIAAVGVGVLESRRSATGAAVLLYALLLAWVGGIVLLTH